MTYPDWQPIETAPRTSKARLVWCPTYQNTYLVSWLEPLGDDLKPDPRQGYWVHFGGVGARLNDTPSHWCPLPEPPK